MRKYFVVFWIFLLCACGGPKYEIRYRYLPPEDPACLRTCEEKFSRCKESFRQERQKCLERSRKEAVKLYEEALKEYERDLALYQERLSLYRKEMLAFREKEAALRGDYRFFKKTCEERNEQYACLRAQELRKILKEMAGEKPSRPEKPSKPRLEEFLAPLRELCREEKLCEERFQKCFLACGGTLVPERICVKNCP